MMPMSSMERTSMDHATHVERQAIMTVGWSNSKRVENDSDGMAEQE
jgi:hypothetical protein